MATQSFMPDMQALNPGRVQQNSPVPQPPQTVQQPQTTNAIGQTNQQPQQSQVTASISQGQAQNQQQSQSVQSTSSPSNVPVSQVSVAAQVAVVPRSPPSHQQSQQQSQSQQQQTSTVVQGTSGAGTPQFITVAVTEQENPTQGTVALQPAQAVHSAYVQYVDGGSDPGLYATTNGQMAGYPVYSVTDSSTMYTPASAAYYNSGSGTSTYSQVGSGVSQATVGVGIQSQILSHQGGGSYLVQGGTIDGEGHPLAHTARASPATVHILEESGAYKVQGALLDGETHHNLTPTSATSTHATRISPVTQRTGLELRELLMVQWLIDNYETAEGVSLPRSTLYSHYLRHCSEHKLEPVNAASFGKLIRSVFLGLRTRRLGTRGNSKYHYYGIRVKPNSPLNQLAEDGNGAALRQQPLAQAKRYKSNVAVKPEALDTGSHATMTSAVGAQNSDNPQTQQQQQQHQQYLGDASAAIPNFIDIEFDSSPLPEGACIDDLEAFKALYREHCEAFLDAVINLQFSMVETLWQSFWRTHSNSHGPNEHEKILTKSKLYVLCKSEPVQQFVQRADYQFYQNLVDVLIPEVLRPIPSSLTQAIRNFAKSLEGWLTSAMGGCPDEMIKVKVNAVSAFAQTLRRYTSLNHLAQAARAVLQNSSQINQMMADLNRVDFHNVQEQASWVCQCDDALVQRLEQDFKITLQQQNSLEQWAAWLEGVVCLVLQPFEGKPEFPKAARQFLLKWSFYSSMVIRDLTLRSAASFGSFHLIRLLYDEYMFYLIEHRVAEATGETPIAVMGEFIGLGAKIMLTGKDLPLLQKNSMSSSTNSVIENGTSDSSCPELSQGTGFSMSSFTNGLKETSAGLSASLQQNLLSQAVMPDGLDDGLLPQNKKLKVT